MALGKSRRGGGSASPKCKTFLRRCMLSDTRGGDLRRAARDCMKAFNRCRSGRGGRR